MWLLCNTERSEALLNLGIVHAGYLNGAYLAGAGMKANGDYGLVTYPWDLADKSNPVPATQKTSLVEVCSSFFASKVQAVADCCAQELAIGGWLIST